MEPTRRAFLSGAGASFATLGAACADFRAALAVVGDGDLLEAYSLDPKINYLNHASIGTMPKIVQQARARYLEVCETNPWLYMWGGEWDEARETTRKRAADLLGCDAEEIAINHNTTEGFNLLAQGLSLGSGDEVLFSSLNHVGASQCWDHHAKQRGYSVRRFEMPMERVAELTAEGVVAIYESEIGARTKVLVLPHIDNVVGIRHPVREIARVARQKGVEFVAVDGAQSVGMIPVNLSELGVDFYCTSPHKWLQSPKGLGLMYLARGAQDRLQPAWVTWGQSRWSDSARRFEDYGTRNLPELLTLGDAIEFRRTVGFAASEARLPGLRAAFRAGVDDSSKLRWRSPREWRDGSSLFAIESVGQSAPKLAERLWREHKIVVRGFAQPNTIRVSPNMMTPQADAIESLMQALLA